MATTEYQVSGMSCGHCEAAVAEEVGALEGVDSVDVSATTGRLVVSGNDLPDDSAVLAAVDEAGYAAEPVP